MTDVDRIRKEINATPKRPREDWPLKGTDADHIIHELWPEWRNLFQQKNQDYSSAGFEPHQILGEKGEFSGIWRKVWKLKKVMWDGESLVGEQKREILMDLIGHCFLALAMHDRRTDKDKDEAVG